MGTIYKKTFTKPLPADAELFARGKRRFARWRDAKGKTRTAPITTSGDGMERLVIEAGTYTAKHRDGAGIVCEVSTGCRDAQAARAVLADLERQAELIRAGVVTSAEATMADHQTKPLVEHFAAYHRQRATKGLSKARIDNAKSRLDRLAADCGFKRLGDLSAERFMTWLTDRMADAPPMSPGNRNEYRLELVTFGNWCVKTGRLTVNPFANVPRADAKSNPNRQRRALTEAELIQLLDAARRRPLLDAQTVRRGVNRGLPLAKLKPEVIERLTRQGRERALIYKTLVLTGLRMRELVSLTIGQLRLDAACPYVELRAADEKNRNGSQIALRSDLAADLACWVKELQTLRTSDSGAPEGRSCLPMTALPQLPAELPSDTPLFDVPAGLLRILDRDLAAAGIAKRDDRGRTVDLHAMRHTFGTLLSKGGVAPRTAQAAMRHSSIDLTMNTYTDPRLLDVHGALDALPALPLNPAPQSSAQANLATGTYGRSPLAPLLAPKSVQACSKQASTDKTAAERRQTDRSAAQRATSYGRNKKDPLTKEVNESCQSGRQDGY